MKQPEFQTNCLPDTESRFFRTARFFKKSVTSGKILSSNQKSPQYSNRKNHAENLAEYVTGLKITHLNADLTTFVDGRLVDDDGSILLRFDNGAKGVLHASQISIGEENGLAIWVYGEKGGLEWHQEHPNHLQVKRIDAPLEVWCRGNGYVAKKSAAAARGTRLPAGHPEAFFEALANIYQNFGETIAAKISGEKPSELALDFPTVDDGVRGMCFIETVLASAKSHEKWTPFKT